MLVEVQNNQAEQMCFEQWCRFCGSTVVVFWRKTLHCSEMCLYVEALVWHNIFLLPCLFRCFFGSTDVMFCGRDPILIQNFCFVPCLFGVVFVPLCLIRCVCGSTDVMFWGRDLILLQNMFVCWSFFWYRVCSTPFYFGVMQLKALLVWFAVFVPMCFLGQRMLCFEGEGDLILLQNCLPACISHLKTILLKMFHNNILRLWTRRSLWRSTTVCWSGQSLTLCSRSTPRRPLARCLPTTSFASFKTSRRTGPPWSRSARRSSSTFRIYSYLTFVTIPDR